MRHLAGSLFIAPLASLALGCGGEEGATRPPAPGTTAAATASPGATAEAEGSDADTTEGSYSSWSGTGGEGGGNEGASARIRGVELEVHEGYERVLIEFGFGDREADGLPRWSLHKPAQGGYVRLRLPGVTSTRTDGEDLAGLATDAYYVVRHPQEGLFVDVVALGAFEYRATELPEMGRLAIDFRRTPGGLTCPVVQDDDTVVTQPCEAEEVTAGEPLAVEGYARDPGGSLTLVLLNEEGAPIAGETAQASAGNKAWRHFQSSVAVPPSYEGLAYLQVGRRPEFGRRGIGEDGGARVRRRGPGRVKLGRVRGGRPSWPARRTGTGRYWSAASCWASLFVSVRELCKATREADRSFLGWARRQSG